MGSRSWPPSATRSSAPPLRQALPTASPPRLPSRLFRALSLSIRTLTRTPRRVQKLIFRRPPRSSRMRFEDVPADFYQNVFYKGFKVKDEEDMLAAGIPIEWAAWLHMIDCPSSPSAGTLQ